MDTIEVVDQQRQKQVEDAKSWLSRLKAVGFPIHAAFWAKRPEDERWKLYLATPAREEIGPIEAYGKVLDALRPLGDFSLRASDAITLISPDDPVAKDILAFQRRFPELAAKELKNQRFGGKFADFHICPLGEVPITIFGVRVREPIGILQLSFEEFKLPLWVEVGNAEESVRYPAESGYQWVVAAPEGSSLEGDDFDRLHLTWTFRGARKRSDANEVMALADLELHGFRILSEPSNLKRASTD